jgi:hypothetical protein
MKRLTLLLLVAMLGSGCAVMRQHCSYYKNGIMEDYRLRSAIIGTGETEMVSTDCAVAGYSTRDTGLSNNGKAALETIAGAAAKMTPAGAAAAAANRGIEAVDDDELLVEKLFGDEEESE